MQENYDLYKKLKQDFLSNPKNKDIINTQKINKFLWTISKLSETLSDKFHIFDVLYDTLILYAIMFGPLYAPLWLHLKIGLFAAAVQLPISFIRYITSDQKLGPNKLPIDTTKLPKNTHMLCINTHLTNSLLGVLSGSIISSIYLLKHNIFSLTRLTKMTMAMIKCTILSTLTEQYDARDLAVVKINDDGTFKMLNKTPDIDVLACNDGAVVITHETVFNQRGFASKITKYLSSYGNYIVIRHNHCFSLYAHLKYGSIKVKEGDIVKQGDKIAIMGNTGNSSAPHLHFEMIYNMPIVGFQGGLGRPLNDFTYKVSSLQDIGDDISITDSEYLDKVKELKILKNNDKFNQKTNTKLTDYGLVKN